MKNCISTTAATLTKIALLGTVAVPLAQCASNPGARDSSVATDTQSETGETEDRHDAMGEWSSAQYKRLHEVRVETSEYAEKILGKLVERLRSQADETGRKLRVLSVGPGDGEFDRALIEQVGTDRIELYYGVEIDGNMYDDLVAHGVGDVPAQFFHSSLEEFSLPAAANDADAANHGVDAVLFVQVIHMMDLNETFEQLPTLLAEGGRAYVGMQSYEGAPRLFESVTAEKWPFRVVEDVEAFIDSNTDFGHSVHTLPCRIDTDHPDIKLAYDFMFGRDSSKWADAIAAKTADGLTENHVVLEIR